MKKIDSYLSDSSKKILDKELVELMLVRGYFFHHYNSILEGVTKENLAGFYNQYGFGPIEIIKTISKIFNLSLIDSTFLSIIILNLLAFISIIYFYGYNTNIIIGYIFSIITVFSVSNIYAPFLYYIRFFPTLILIFILNTETKLKKEYIIYLILLIIGIYNKEYAIFTSASLFLVYLLKNNLNYLKYSLAILASLIGIFIFAQKPEITGANFLAIISGVGFSSGISVDYVLWSMLTITILFIIYFSNKLKEISNGDLFLAICLVVFSIKFVSNPGINHVGPLFLLLYILTFNLNKKNILPAHLYLNGSLIFISSIMLIGNIPVLMSSNFTKKYDIASYETSKISQFFYLDSGLKLKGEQLIELTKEVKYCLISQQDDFYQIYTGKHLTGKMPNLSTNINYPIDLDYVKEGFVTCKYIVVDKELLSNDSEKYLIKSLYNRDKRLDQYISAYLYDRERLKYAIPLLTKNVKFINENKDFVLFKNMNNQNDD